MNTLRVASCQFPIQADVATNEKHILDLMTQAARREANLVHFSEAALSGYAGVDFYTWDGYDWDALRAATRRVQAAARAFGQWVVLGSSHFLGEGLKPTNCLYIIDDKGQLVDRYDKSMLTDIDQLSYSAGDRGLTVDIHGITCGFLICYDVCYPEMYARYRAAGAQLVFHSFHNARAGQVTILDEMGPAWLRVRAADNKLWIVANNGTQEHQNWASCMVRPDGSIAEQLERHQTGMNVHDFPDGFLTGWTHNEKPFKLAPDEVFVRGEVIPHPRRLDRLAEP